MNFEYLTELVCVVIAVFSLGGFVFERTKRKSLEDIKIVYRRDATTVSKRKQSQAEINYKEVLKYMKEHNADKNTAIGIVSEVSNS